MTNSHGGQKIFECPDCGDAFVDFDTLKTHFKELHEVVKVDEEQHVGVKRKREGRARKLNKAAKRLRH